VADESLSALLYAVLLAADGAGRVVADEMGMSVTDTTALQHLTTRGPAGPVDLGRMLGIGSAAATMLADRLERAGHVERRPHPADRRRLQLVPTERATREAWRVLQPLLGRVDAVEGGLEADDRAVVARYLRAVASAYEDYIASR
jgi:DNA-binding MarR family transcriptional regulator